MLFAKKGNLPNMRQQGIVLIMSLVILLVLTLLGVTAMNTSNLQLLMTGNSQYQTTALNIAEDTIKNAEDIVEGIVAGAAKPANGYYDIAATPADEIDLANFDWDASKVVTDGASRYVIEYTGDHTLDSASLKWRQSQNILGDKVYVFRITARSPATRGAVRYVQSIFVTLISPS